MWDNEDLFTNVLNFLGVRDVGRLSCTCVFMKNLVEKSNFFENLRVVKKVRSARKDKKGNVYVCIFKRCATLCVCGFCEYGWNLNLNRQVTPCTIPSTMTMVSDLSNAKNVAKCVVEFLKDKKDSFLMSVSNITTGKLEAIYQSPDYIMGALVPDERSKKFVYRIYLNDHGTYDIAPFFT